MARSWIGTRPYDGTVRDRAETDALSPFGQFSAEDLSPRTTGCRYPMRGPDEDGLDEEDVVDLLERVEHGLQAAPNSTRYGRLTR